MRLLPMSSPLTCRFENGSLALGAIVGSLFSSSMMMGMAGLLLVRRWCTYLVALITLGGVRSFDVGAVIGLGAALPLTLGGCIDSTLGGVVLVMMDYRALMWHAWVSLSAAPGGVFCFINCKNCCAARRVRSAWRVKGRCSLLGRGGRCLFYAPLWCG